MKKILLIFVIGAFVIGNFGGCKNRDNQAADSTKLSNILTVDSFLAAPEKWDGKVVIITGTVSHICRHSGKKLFLFSSDPEKTVKVNSGGDFSTFDIKYEGVDVELTGTVIVDDKIDANYLNEWEEEIKNSITDKDQKVCTEENKAISGQTNDKTKKEETVKDPYSDVKEFRQKLAVSGKTYISIYAIDCKSMKEIKKQN